MVMSILKLKGGESHGNVRTETERERVMIMSRLKLKGGESHGDVLTETERGRVTW